MNESNGEPTNWFVTFILYYVSFAVLIPVVFIFGFLVLQLLFFGVLGNAVLACVFVVERVNPSEKARRNREAQSRKARQAVKD